MKKKELYNIAKQIADAELIIQNNGSQEEIQKAMIDVISISNKIHSIEDLETIDEIVQNILLKNS